MKKCVGLISICLAWAVSINAQLPSSVNSNTKSAVTREKLKPLHSDLIIISSENSYPAFSGSKAPIYLTLDTVNSIHSPSYSLNSDFTADIPKNAYGFHNGRLLFRTTGATSSGTITGSGVVGTGSSLGNIGSTGSGIGLNGKTPNAGSAMWGNARGFLSIPQERKITGQ